MLTLLELYHHSVQSRYTGPEAYFDVSVSTPTGEQTLRVLCKVIVDFTASAKFICLFVPDAPLAYGAVLYILDNLKTATSGIDGMIFKEPRAGERMFDSAEAVFTGRVLLYFDGALSGAQESEITSRALEKGIRVQLRTRKYLQAELDSVRPLAFVSHDSRDKESVVRPLVQQLVLQLCSVWYDEYSIQLGASLRETIERGLKECKKCVLVLSRNFLGNGGWTKTEFNAVFTRELVEASDVIIPIWVDVEKRDVYDYSPWLADRMAIKWEGKPELAAARIARVLRT